MNPSLGLRDIQGLDAISWWPLAPGWWILIGVTILTALLGAVLRARKKRKMRKWQFHVLAELNTLEGNLCPENSQITAVKLSELMRRLAIQHYTRKACAGLAGEAWLQWLSQRDFSKFNWSQSSRCLIEAPFSPHGKVFDLNSIKTTIRAAKGWVK